MAEDEKPRPKVDVNLSVGGLGGLFKSFGELVDLVGGMIEAGEQERSQSGTLRMNGLGENVQGVYGFTVRTGLGGQPSVERFGNIRSGDEGPVVAETREPLVDLFDEQDELVVVAELPGVDEGEIGVTLTGDVLAIETTGRRRFAREVLLEAAVVPDSLRQTYRNGILELRLRKATEAGA